MGDLLSGRCEGGDTRQTLEYLNAAGIQEDLDGPLFRPLATDRKNLVRAHIPLQMRWAIVQAGAREACIDTDRIGTCGVGVHSLRKTAITDALRHGAAIIQVMELAGHSDIRSTPRIRDGSGSPIRAGHATDVQGEMHDNPRGRERMKGEYT